MIPRAVSISPLQVIAKVKTMARVIYTIAIIGIALMCVLAAEEEKYSDRYDDVDVDGILANNKLRDQYYSCFMGEGKCVTADQKFFSKIASEAFVDQCKKCTEKQKIFLDKISDWYTTNQPDKWNRFVAKSLEDAKQRAKQSS